MFKMVLLVMFH